MSNRTFAKLCVLHMGTALVVTLLAMWIFYLLGYTELAPIVIFGLIVGGYPGVIRHCYGVGFRDGRSSTQASGESGISP